MSSAECSETPHSPKNSLTYLIHGIWQLTCMHSCTSLQLVYMMSVAHFYWFCLAHIVSVVKIKHLHSRVAGASTFIRLAQSTVSVCGSSYVHGARPLFRHNQSGTRRPPNTTFLLYKWNFANRPASSLQLRIFTNITPHWLLKRSYIAYKVRVHSVQQLNIKKRLLRPDRYLFHFVLALLPVETAGGVIGQHRSRDKYHEYNFNAASVHAR